jgi:hypothetical protein
LFLVIGLSGLGFVKYYALKFCELQHFFLLTHMILYIYILHCQLHIIMPIENLKWIKMRFYHFFYPPQITREVKGEKV